MFLLLSCLGSVGACEGVTKPFVREHKMVKSIHVEKLLKDSHLPMGNL